MTHHDNAIKAVDYLKETFEKNRRSPNLRFDNMVGREKVEKP